MTTLTIPLPKKEKERLNRLAIRYGLSLENFSRKILEEITSDITEESFKDYENSDELKESFKKALNDWRKGRVYKQI